MKTNIQIPKFLIQLRWARGLITASCLVFLFLGGGCRSVPNETYHCYDEQGKPLEGVLFVCDYGLANAPTVGVDYRFSDKEGVVRFHRDAISKNAAGSMRNMRTVFSDRTHSGAPGDGESYIEGKDPVPDWPVCTTAFTNKMLFKNANDDPTRWLFSINCLLNLVKNIQLREYGMEGPGIERLEAMIVPFAKKERVAFIEKYGEEIAPVNFITKVAADRVWWYRAGLKSRNYMPPGSNTELNYKTLFSTTKNKTVKFKDLTIYIP